MYGAGVGDETRKALLHMRRALFRGLGASE